MQTITVIARWEDRQMKPEDEWQLWRQLKGAFKVDSFIFVPILIPRFGFNQYETMEEALEHAQGTVCYLEPKGKHSVSNLIDIEGDITLVLGNTGKDNLSLANPNYTYRIDTPGDTDMFGTNAAAIALHWYHR